jgi:uncharacterized membrane protein YkoI
MKSFTHLALGFLVFTSATSIAATMQENALKYVPGGKIIQEKKNEIKVQTPDGSIVEVEFKRNGNLEEASGDTVEKDIFVPGEGLLSLKDAYAAMTKAGKKPVGDWSLDESMIKGWHYEFEGVENGKNMDYVVDAKTGKIVDSKVDD